MKKYAVMLLSVLMFVVLCETSFAAMTRCTHCFGTGKVDCGICLGSGICQGCYGKGTVGYIPDFSGNGSGGYVECPNCHGDGKCWKCHGEREVQCSFCGGTGQRYTYDPIADLGLDTNRNTNTNNNTNTNTNAINNIATKLGTTTGNVNYIPVLGTSQTPTTRIKEALSAIGREIVSTQGSLNINKSGYYAFPLTVPASLVGTNTALKVYLADRSAFNDSAFDSSAVTAPLTAAQIFTNSGGIVTTLPSTIIAAVNLQTNTTKTFSTHITKAKTASTNTNTNTNTRTNTNANNNGNIGSSGGGGGCNSLHVLPAIIFAAVLAFRKIRG